MRFGLFLDADGVAVALVDVGELVGVDPRVEDANVVVEGNERDETTAHTTREVADVSYDGLQSRQDNARGHT